MTTLTAGDYAERLAELLILLGYDATPITDAGETGAVDWFAARDWDTAERYVARRCAYALRRLADPFATGKPTTDARIALGAYEHLSLGGNR